MTHDKCVPKLIGGDLELGNFITGRGSAGRKTDQEAAQLLLERIEGLPLREQQSAFSANSAAAGGWYSSVGQYYGSRTSYVNPQDRGRRYLSDNGGCIYIDLNHLELATPETLCARAHQAAWMAMLRKARTAQDAANAGLPRDRRVVVLANNSDRQGNSYGGHQSFLMHRDAYDNMINRRMVPSLFQLMAHQISSIVITGQGKVGSENGQEWVDFQLSQRADFMETLLGEQTTYNRPLINTRNEPLCGPTSRQGDLPGDIYKRLHVIFFDTNMAPTAVYLKNGLMQLVLSMIEQEWIDEELMLDSPLAALQAWSRDPDLTVAMPLRSGRQVTAVELQMAFLAQAEALHKQDGFQGLVPGAGEIIALWRDTLEKLAEKNFTALQGRIDWIMKRALITQSLTENSNWSWDSAEVRYLDQVYASLDPTDSLFFALQQEGLFEPIATEQEIAHFVDEPPSDTRAWTRAMLLRRLEPEIVSRVDWDRINLSAAAGRGTRLEIGLPDPLAATRLQTEHIFNSTAALPELLERLQDCGAITLSATPNRARPMHPITGYTEQHVH